MRSSGAATRALAVLLLALPAPAQALKFLSPGPLAKGHAHLEGLEKCGECHEPGKQQTPQRCLACHKELHERINTGKGLHGRMPADKRDCKTCHREHKGREFPLVDWGPGEKFFDHARTGWKLEGRHAKTKCADCHQLRRIVDPAVRKLLAERPERRTNMGLSTRCVDCHFNEHRNQLGTDCLKCHDNRAFKPAAKYDHAKNPEFPREGKHRKVECVKCHPLRPDLAPPPPEAFPQPRQLVYAQFKNIRHANCVDCHKDKHEGKFGAACKNCHSPEDWKKTRDLSAERAFHDKTRYPLRGGHLRAPCASCHGKPTKLKGLRFEACTDCHADAHLGQLQGPEGKRCERCHGLDVFAPSNFTDEMHRSNRFQLGGAHLAVACSLCHPEQPELAARIDPALRQALVKTGRPQLFSLQRFDPPAGPLERCETCHRDPHAGQFRQGAGAKACTACHDTAGFRALRFEHSRDARFKRDGRHEKVACGACHRTEEYAGARVVRYRPLSSACGSCHTDVHLGQLARDGTTDCARCHDTTGFRPKTRFLHEPPFTEFRLEGKHKKAECAKCHPSAEVAPGTRAARWKPLPVRCAGCHADFHKGAMRAFEPAAPTRGVPAAALPVPGRAGVEPAASEKETRCEGCHSPETWKPARFAHERTGFALVGRHKNQSCDACHAEGFGKSTPAGCASCHSDPHAGELGSQCATCHDGEADDWRSLYRADAHRRTNFPLSGKHALLPCQECHLNTAPRRFADAAAGCVACHRADWERTSRSAIDHAALGISTDCRSCHDPWRWAPARFDRHEFCFSIASEGHARMRCLDCHTSLTTARISGACATDTASCTRCHSCGPNEKKHAQVPGYDCRDRKCYECHRFLRGGD